MSKTVKEAMQETFALAKLPDNLPTVLSYYNTMNWLGNLADSRKFDKAFVCAHFTQRYPEHELTKSLKEPNIEYANRLIAETLDAYLDEYNQQTRLKIDLDERSSGLSYKTLFGTSVSTLARIQYTTGLIDVVPKTEGFIYVIRYKKDGKWKLDYDTTHLYLNDDDRGPNGVRYLGQFVRVRDLDSCPNHDDAEWLDLLLEQLEEHYGDTEYELCVLPIDLTVPLGDRYDPNGSWDVDKQIYVMDANVGGSDVAIPLNTIEAMVGEGGDLLRLIRPTTDPEKGESEEGVYTLSDMEYNPRCIGDVRVDEITTTVRRIDLMLDDRKFDFEEEIKRIDPNLIQEGMRYGYVGLRHVESPNNHHAVFFSLGFSEVNITPEDMLKFIESFHAIADKLGTDIITEYDLQPVVENNVLLTKLFSSIIKYHSSRTLGTCNIRTGKTMGVRWIARNNVSQRDIVDALNRNLSFIDSTYIVGERVKTVGLNEDNVVTAVVDLSFGSKERLYNIQKLVYNAKERQVMIVKPVFEHGGANDENGNECLHSTQIKRVKDRTFVITPDMVVDLGNMFIYNKMNKHICLRLVAKGKMTIMSTPQGHLFGIDK
jgi:hypothetical protein|nr:MAG TPA: hypothetical protein [Caudoviricetes sp.]